MVTVDSGFDAERVRELLHELGRRLDDAGLAGRMFVVGGATMALAYDRDRLTEDIDAVFEPKRRIYEEAARMADDHHLPPDWLNDAVRGFLPGPDRGMGNRSFETPGLAVEIASPHHLFAMKAAAARSERDHDDLVTLIEACDIRSVDDAFDIIESSYGRDRLQPKTQFVIESIVTDALADG